MRVDKIEARLKALLKQGSNKRCINCDSLGPQYVVCSFNVFVCTVCSGVHRQFGHRVKGVSMSTFKTEEVTTLEESGNAKFAAFFLNKWSSTALPKPVDRDVRRINTWITAVYQDRRFYGEPAGGWVAGSSGAVSAANSSTSEGREPAVRPMSDVLGSDTPKLSVQGSGNLERTISTVSSTAGGSATPTKPANGAAGVAAATSGISSLAVSSPQPTRPAPPPPAAAAAAAWDPFGSPTAAAAAAAAEAAAPAWASPSPAAEPAAEQAWASFGDPPAQQQAAPAAAATASPPPAGPSAAPAAEGAGGWEAFGDGPTPDQPAAAALQMPTAQQPKAQPVRSASRPEVPMDVFYPEFEHIRATGMLPTGQPVPLPSFAHSYGTGSARQQAPAASNPFAYGPPAAAAGQAAHGGGAALGGRPTIAIPPAPQHPGYGYSGVSPAARASPGYSASSAQSPAGSLVSPGGSAYSAGGGASNGVAALRSSTGSLSELMPGSAAPTPAAHRLGDPLGAAQDPFAGLAPGLRGAGLPSSGSARFGAAAPPPTPAGMPSFHAGASSPYGAPAAAAPFAASLPSPAAHTHGMAPSTAAATATLYGRTPSVSGYDLAAPSAPKPQATGNPFA
ncbi:putative ADP-ribosylation factor GTPase-activating protein AGD14 [Chlorella vulgaris]